MILKKPIFILTILSLVFTLVLAVPQSALATPPMVPCPEGTFIAKYDWSGNAWVLSEGDDVITFAPGSDLQSGTWWSSVLIGFVVYTDGGERYWDELFDPPTYGPENYDASLSMPDGHDISNIEFCGPAFPVTLASFAAQANRGTVTIKWTTATEINTAGFLLYRSTTANGTQVQLTEKLISAQGSEVAGASYLVTDTPGYGTFYYWLKDVDYSGSSGLNGPAVVKVLPAIIVPAYRPSLPGQ